MRYEIRARSFGELLDGGFQLYRDQFPTFVKISALISIPASVVYGVITAAIIGRGYVLGDPIPTDSVFRILVAIYAPLPIVWFAYLIQQAALTAAIADAYLGRPLNASSALRRAWSAARNLVVGSLEYSIVGGLGLMACVIPGVIYMLHRLFYAQVIMIENASVGESFRRSMALIKPRRAQIVGLAIVLPIIQQSISIGFATLVPRVIKAIPVLGSVVQQLPFVVLAPLLPAVFTLAYFDARVRDEAFDLEVLAQETFGSEIPVALPLA